MKNYIIVGVVLVVGILLIIFLVRNKDSLNNELSNAGDNLSITPGTDIKTSPDDTKDANNIINENNTNNTKQMTSATLNTNKGSITIEFFETEAPKTTENFIKLAKSGFYDGVKFHRVIKGFMIQGGDPISKDNSRMDFWGTGGPGYKFADEIDAKSALYVEGYKKGIVAMANSGPNTNGSQFFIMNEDYPLPPLYTIFGKVTSGQDVVDKIALVQTGANDRPVDAVIINSIKVN